MEGYDAKFDPSLTKRLECPICLLALREPMQTPCGHRFCSPCITRALRETSTRCPVDNTSVESHQLFKDNFAKREVLCLNVLCAANDHGCAWRGELRDLETHFQLCELVKIDCPHKCGHACQRKLISTHLAGCPNKPQLCPLCSVTFVLNKVEDHRPHCSKIKVPVTLLGDLKEASEVLKWTGHLKVKMNPHSSSSQAVHQFNGYLTAKAETDESFMYTGNWCSNLNVMGLNNGTSHVFLQALRSPEVVTCKFFFHPLGKDKTNPFIKMLRRKSNDQCAAVGLYLKANTSRQDLTVMYFHWSEQKKRTIATVADLKNHMVRQIQSRLHSLQQNSRTGRGRSSAAHSGSRGAHSSRTHPPVSSHEHRSHHGYHRGAAVRSAPHPHMHHQLHPSHPIAHAAVAGTTPTTVLPHLLSWQTSQSFNTYPWRVQNNVPFFTFPSTPPQYLPANSYPYTFAPLPAAPFSISPMQPVVTHALPVPMTNEHVPVAVTLGNPNPVPPLAVSVNVIQQPVIHGPTQAQDSSAANQDVAIIHSLGPTHQHFQAAHVTPVPFVQTDGGILQNRASVALPNPAHMISLEQPMNIGMAMNQSLHVNPPNGDSNHHLVNSAESVRLSNMWMHSEPGPSNRHHSLVVSPSDTSESASSSPSDSFSSMFYPSLDSDMLDTPPMIHSPPDMFRGNRHDLSFTSSNSSETESDSSDQTALQTLANAAMSLTGDNDNSDQVNSSQGGPLRLPVLINISDSEPDSNATTPASVIDLTSSPLTNASSTFVTPTSDQQSSSNNPPPSDNAPPPVLVPVIHHRGANSGQPSASRRALNFTAEQEEAVQQARFDNPTLAVPPGSILATAPTAVLRGSVLNAAHHPPPHPMVAAVAPPTALPPGVAAIPAQVLGWQPTFEAPPTQPHPQPVSDVPMGGHLNILVPPNVVPGQAYPSAMIPQQSRGEFWETVMPSLDMTLQNGSAEGRSNTQ